MRILLILISCFITGLCFFSVYFQSAKKVRVGLRYYYLVRRDEYSEAEAITVYNQGGASYLLEDGEEKKIALAVYTNAEDAYEIENMLSKQEAVVVLEKQIETLYFKGSKQKNLADTCVNGMKTLDGYVRALEKCVYRLDNGVSQEKIREILSLICRGLKYCAKIYGKDFSALSQIFAKVQKELESICDSVVMAKDLRYLACEMAEGNIALSKEFAL